MEDKAKELLDMELEKETTYKGYNGRIYTLYELRTSANNYSVNAPATYRRLIKEKYSRIYNCPDENIPVEFLKEVYGVNDEIKEIWKSVPGYSNENFYKVSNFGRIKHFDKLMAQDEDKELSGYLKMKGYLDESDNKYRFNASTPIYKFIASAFFDDYKDGLHIHHINNNGYDCRPDNLILLTPREHSKVHGFFVSGDKE